MKRVLRAAVVTAAATALGGAVAERKWIAAPHYRGPVTDHFDGVRFHNPGGDTRQGSFWKWMATRDRGFWPKWRDAPFGPPPPRRVERDTLRVTFINHATLLIQTEGVNILTDPIWSDRTSPVSFAGPKRHRPPGIRFEDLPPIDVVLVSHNHYDHLDIPTLQRLRTPILTPLGNGAVMARHGIGGATELDWWQSIALPHGVTITVVPARHFSSRGLSDRDVNLWGGFVIGTASGNTYFAGDTGFGPHFAEIGRRFAPIRLALLPIGAYRPRWFMKPVHMEPAEAVEAHKALHAETSVAMHYGTFALGDDGEMEPVHDLERAISAAGHPRFWILEHGEGREVPACIGPSEPSRTASSTTSR